MRPTYLLSFQRIIYVKSPLVLVRASFKSFQVKNNKNLAELWRNNYIAGIHSGKTKIYYNSSIHISYTGLEDV